MQVTLGEEGSGLSAAAAPRFRVKKGERRKAALRRRKKEGRRSDLVSFMEERERWQRAVVALQLATSDCSAEMNAHFV